MAVKNRGIKRASEATSKQSKKAKIVQAESQSESEVSSQEESDASSESSSDELDQSEDELDQSEDQLDQSADELDQSEDGLDGSDDEDKENITDPNKKSSKEQHAEQRKMLAERKLKRKSGIQVQQIKSLWERLRVNKPTPAKEIRDKLSNEIWELSKDCIPDLVMKHDSSRVVQTLVKYSSKERRDLIVRSLRGSFYVLATSAYGKYLMIKLLHYGSKESRGLIVDELHGKLRKLMRHREGAYVVEDLFVLYSNAEQKQQMIREFWGAEYAVFKESGKGKSVLDIVNESTEKKQLILTNLSGTITASVEKGSTGFQILHAAMKEYVSILVSDLDQYDTQIREFEELLGEQFAELVHTREGSEVACWLIAIANAKERRNLMRSLKKHGKELIKNEYGNLVLITLFLTVDDTVSLHKNFDNELFTPELLPEVLQEKFSRRPLLYLLKGLDGKYFNPLVKKELLKYEELAYKKTSKKPQEQRRAELVEKALPQVYKNLLEVIKVDENAFVNQVLSANLGAQTLAELILTPSANEEINTTLRPKLIDVIFNSVIKGDVLEDYHLLNKIPFISRLIKLLTHGNEFKFDSEKKKLTQLKSETPLPGTGKEFSIRVLDEIVENGKLADWCTGQGSFIVLSVYEVLETSKETEKLKELKKHLKKIKKQLADDKGNKGAQIILKILN
ncbi:Pumilio y domain member 6 [Yamadazyma tenuis]|uniref:PUM-HD domain-containing protein n=1 Tax=Candida tenuis (strain ATCC 10573 / BCRC 21748 / CBS 615 / JCM 9827 / NBRC 10315 / NRRL Y-1498 / VKM Y-70) TaxID=590646 RepID=G3B4P2_CANTC|nr:uncharacterized protein CANTEDRAFT_105299 [Yamadazyma tenuis ATCC 10573]EGV63994.1 hypothetical protein CANTEDRAFT_105299 [Yamadazyma tenuis ATCC 10573]WEJ96386.1 Pumilio y domain member 6 [Yamadazyma tenuis]